MSQAAVPIKRDSPWLGWCGNTSPAAILGLLAQEDPPCANVPAAAREDVRAGPSFSLLEETAAMAADSAASGARCAMKLWADVSTVVKLVFICLVVGLVLGFCLRGMPSFTAPPSAPAPSEAVNRPATTP